MEVEEYILKDEKLRSKLDEAWKMIIHHYLKEILQFCWPVAFNDIDWEKPYEFLEQELLAIRQFSNKKVTDKLIKVYLKSGIEQWLLIHMEVQGQREIDFDKRMYISNYRIFDLYQKTIVSMAILIDSNKNWRSKTYKQEKWGYSLQMKFPIIKILDYKGREQELALSNNPFAMAILCQLKAIEAGRNENKKLFFKKMLIKMLYEKGFIREEIINFARFLEGLFVVSIPKGLEYNLYVKSIEKEKNVSLLTSFEEAGYDKASQDMLLGLLNIKFQKYPDKYKSKIETADSKQLMKWAERLLYCNRIEEIFE